MQIGYARVSTQDQNLESQRDALRQAGCERIFEDKMSGVREARPALMDALSVMAEGDTLVIWKLSRLGRSVKQLIETAQLLADRGIALKSLQEHLDTSTASGKLFFHVIAAFAQFERDNTIENTRAGLAAAKARGRRGGRRPVMDDARQARALVLIASHPELSVDGVCAALNVSRATFYRSRLNALPEPVPGSAYKPCP